MKLAKTTLEPTIIDAVAHRTASGFNANPSKPQNSPYRVVSSGASRGTSKKVVVSVTTQPVAAWMMSVNRCIVHSNVRQAVQDICILEISESWTLR